MRLVIREMTKFYKREFIRNDKRKLLLFGYNNHNENAGSKLEINNRQII